MDEGLAVSPFSGNISFISSSSERLKRGSDRRSPLDPVMALFF